jgi:NhaP-type Na+/H+ or K+/H+ antiporter
LAIDLLRISDGLGIGMALTACVVYFIFPYGLSLDLSMTFGAILLATDPVTVAVLLNDLGTVASNSILALRMKDQ